MFAHEVRMGRINRRGHFRPRIASRARRQTFSRTHPFAPSGLLERSDLRLSDME
jgi:hypothetical protein